MASQQHSMLGQSQVEDPMAVFAAPEDGDAMDGMLSAIMSIPGIDEQQRPMLVDALTRVATAFGGGALGQPGGPSTMPGAAAAAAAMAAVAATAALAASGGEGDLSDHVGLEEKVRRAHAGAARPFMMMPQLLQLPHAFADLEARMGRIEGDMSVQGGGPLPQRGAGAGGTAGTAREVDLLRARAGRLEHEVAALRAQTARRLDAAARETALSRRDAEEARAEVAVLRAEVDRLRQAHGEEGSEKREAEGMTTTLPGGVVAPQSTVPLRGDRVAARPASTGAQALLAPRLPQRGLSHPSQHGPGG